MQNTVSSSTSPIRSPNDKFRLIVDVTAKPHVDVDVILKHVSKEIHDNMLTMNCLFGAQSFYDERFVSAVMSRIVMQLGDQIMKDYTFCDNDFKLNVTVQKKTG